MSAIEEFFEEVDAKWRWPSAARIQLEVIGSAALMLQAGYERGTKDGGVLRTGDLSEETTTRLLEIAGEGSVIHTRRRLYIDIVPGAVPFLPQMPRWHPLADLNASLEHFELSVLDVVDVVVSKLKRLSENDVSDIEAMIDRNLVLHDVLVARFRLAVDYFACDARAEDLPKYVNNLHRVERDLLDVEETAIEFPGWI